MPDPRGWRWWMAWAAAVIAFGAAVDPVAILRGMLIGAGIMAVAVGLGDAGERLRGSWRRRSDPP